MTMRTICIPFFVLFAVLASTISAQLLSERESIDRIIEVIERPARNSDMKMRDYEQAIVMLDRFERDYRSPEGTATAAFLRGGSYMGLGRYDEALTLLNTAVEGVLDEAYIPVAHYIRGRVLLERGRTADGIHALQTAMAADPSHNIVPSARLMLAHGLIEESRFAEAHAHVDTILVKPAPGWIVQGATMLRDNLRFIGNPAPPFSATTIDGKRIRLADYRGTVVLIDFWASWCQPCIDALPDVQNAYRRYSGDGFHVVAISLDRSRGALDSFMRNNDMPWTHIYEGGQQLAEMYNVTGIPQTFLIDQSGTVVAVNPSHNRLSRVVESLLKAD